MKVIIPTSQDFYEASLKIVFFFFFKTYSTVPSMQLVTNFYSYFYYFLVFFFLAFQFVYFTYDLMLVTKIFVDRYKGGWPFDI